MVKKLIKILFYYDEKGEELRMEENYKIMYIDVKSCARCGQDHDHVLFQAFTKPILNAEMDELLFLYWGMCPILAEPILLNMYVSGE